MRSTTAYSVRPPGRKTTRAQIAAIGESVRLGLIQSGVEVGQVSRYEQVAVVVFLPLDCVEIVQKTVDVRALPLGDGMDGYFGYFAAERIRVPAAACRVE